MRQLLLILVFVHAVGACKFPELPPIDEDGSDDSATSDSTADSIDAPAGPLGGVTLAQAVVIGSLAEPDILAPPGGGVILSMGYVHSTPISIAGTTIPCTRCDAIAKLNADLSSVEWYVYSEQSGGSAIAMSPSGDVYWHLHGEESGTLTVRGSAITTPVSVPVPSNSGAQSGGARIVLALSESGTVRWHHSLSRTDSASTSGLDQVSGFGASDGAVFSSYHGALGTLSYVDMAGAAASRTVGTASQVIHELDPITGRTAQLATRALNTAGDQFSRVVGMPGFGGKRFVTQRQSYSASGQTTANTVSIGTLGNGAFVPNVNYAVTVPSGPADLGPSRFQNGVFGRAPVGTSITVGSSSYAAPSTNGDAMYFALDGVTSSVRAAVAFASTGSEFPIAVEDAGNGDAYCIGIYQSTNLTIGGTSLPPVADAQSRAMYLVRARVDSTLMTFVPVWAVGYAASGLLFLDAAASDQVTNDLYVLGALGSSGTVDLGLTPIAAPANVTAVFLLRIQRGA